MGVVRGVFKVVTGMGKIALGGAMHDGPSQICPKCGGVHHGACTSCASTEATKSVTEGLQEIKDSL